MARYIKSRYPHIFIAVGGVHASLNPEAGHSRGLDAVCIGEGEYPVVELAAQLEKGLTPSGISNFWFKRMAG